MRVLTFFLPSLVACSASTDNITVSLAPDVVSSIDGSLGVRATAFADRSPSGGESVSITVAYTDRNGTAHDIPSAQGETNANGVLEATLTGLSWDGTGTVTATVEGTDITAEATFAVLDRTPPTVTITPPAANQIRAGQDVRAMVRVKDEIGISQVFFEAGDGIGRDRATVIASGSIDTSISFDFQIPQNAQVGSMISLHALAGDLSGNLAAAPAVSVVVVP